MIFHENRLPADDSHEISFLISDRSYEYAKYMFENVLNEGKRKKLQGYAKTRLLQKNPLSKINLTILNQTIFCGYHNSK